MVPASLELKLPGCPDPAGGRSRWPLSTCSPAQSGFFSEGVSSGGILSVTPFVTQEKDQTETVACAVFHFYSSRQHSIVIVRGSQVQRKPRLIHA